nr:phosphosulfolactate synthase [Sunxiuqinia sp.]
YTDFVKLGFGTGLLTPRLKDKISLYKSAGVRPYFGGTLFEAFVARNMFDDYRKFITDSGVETAEVSDGVLPIEHDKKCQYIADLAKDFEIFSEVGTKLRGKEISNSEWVSWMKSELEAGAWKVIAEARESGNMGIYQEDGSANSQLIMDIKKEINTEHILWEAPLKSQQVWFIKLLGANVNLGNISETEVIPLETLRRGLRGDTLLSFLP